MSGSAAAQHFNVILAATDEASPVLAKARAQIAAARAEAERIAPALGGRGVFAALTGHVNVVRGAFGELRASVGGLYGRAAGILPVLGGLGAVGSLAGIAKMIESAAEARAAFAAQAERIGVMPALLARYNYAARLTHVETESMQGGLMKLDRSLFKAAQGDKTLTGLFRAMGVRVKDSKGELRNMADVLPEIAESFKRTQNPATRVAMAMTLFGRAGAELIPLLIQGKEGFAAMGDSYAQLATVLTPQQIAALEAYHKHIVNIDTAAKGFKNTLAGNFAILFNPILEGIEQWTVKNKGWLASSITKDVERFVEAITYLNSVKLPDWLVNQEDGNLWAFAKGAKRLLQGPAASSLEDIADFVRKKLAERDVARAQGDENARMNRRNNERGYILGSNNGQFRLSDARLADQSTDERPLFASYEREEAPYLGRGLLSLFGVGRTAPGGLLDPPSVPSELIIRFENAPEGMATAVTPSGRIAIRVEGAPTGPAFGSQGRSASPRNER